MEAILKIVGANEIFKHLVDKTFAAEKIITNESGAFIAAEIQGLDDIFFDLGARVTILDDYLVVEGVASIGANTGRIAVKINNLFSRNGD
jgi:hypothetical protein